MRRILSLGLVLISVACATDFTLSAVKSDLRAERIDDAVRKIDGLAARQPHSYEVQYLRGAAHAEAAIRRLYAEDEAAYLDHVKTAFDGYTRALRLDPRRAAPHVGVATLLYYQGDMKGAVEELRVARMLEPLNPMHSVNLAQIYVYTGRVNRARSLLEQARKLGVHPVYAETVEMLASWRQGDLVDARDLFDMASQNPREFEAAKRMLQDDPNIEPKFASFDEMARYCCAAATCGPHMGDACTRLELEVRQRQVAAATEAQEREAAAERRQALLEVFGGEKQVEVEVEDDEDADEP